MSFAYVDVDDCGSEIVQRPRTPQVPLEDFFSQSSDSAGSPPEIVNSFDCCSELSDSGCGTHSESEDEDSETEGCYQVNPVPAFIKSRKDTLRSAETNKSTDEKCSTTSEEPAPSVLPELLPDIVISADSSVVPKPLYSQTKPAVVDKESTVSSADSSVFCNDLTREEDALRRRKVASLVRRFSAHDEIVVMPREAKGTRTLQKIKQTVSTGLSPTTPCDTEIERRKRVFSLVRQFDEDQVADGNPSKFPTTSLRGTREIERHAGNREVSVFSSNSDSETLKAAAHTVTKNTHAFPDAKDTVLLSGALSHTTNKVDNCTGEISREKTMALYSLDEVFSQKSVHLKPTSLSHSSSLIDVSSRDTETEDSQSFAESEDARRRSVVSLVEFYDTFGYWKVVPNNSHVSVHRGKPAVQVSSQFAEDVNTNKDVVASSTKHGEYRTSFDELQPTSNEASSHGNFTRSPASITLSTSRPQVRIDQGKRTSFGSVQQTNLLYWKRLGYVFLEQFLLKYGWSFAGMIIVAIPIIYTKNDTLGVEIRTQGYTVARNLLITIADAIERIMSSYKEITELSGYTSRVCEMLRVFAQVHQGVLQRVSATSNETLNPGRLVDTCDGLRLDNVPIVTPTGDVISEPITLEFTPGQHILITGPNGCGKSSLFRILGGLWPIYGGTLYRSRNISIFYIPQKPYMTAGGSLRAQVIYPDEESKCGDDELDRIMGLVQLGSVVKREGGWNAVNDWMEVLSGGEKQRVAIARVFYHRPQFALLDECTSAVSIDVEGSIYAAIRDAGITLLTITHRPSLWKYHSHILKFDGAGAWSFGELDLAEQSKADLIAN